MRFENFDNHTKPKLASEFNGKKIVGFWRPGGAGNGDGEHLTTKKDGDSLVGKFGKKNVAAENCADDQMNGSGCSRNAVDRVFTPLSSSHRHLRI